MKKKFDVTDLPKDPGFKVPEHYFEALPTRIMERTAYAKSASTSPVAWFMQFKTALAGASLAVVFALSFLASHYFSSDSSTQEVMAQVSEKEIYQYLVTHVELETSDLAELPAVKARQPLEFLDVRASDLNVDQAKELLEESYQYQ